MFGKIAKFQKPLASATLITVVSAATKEEQKARSTEPIKQRACDLPVYISKQEEKKCHPNVFTQSSPIAQSIEDGITGARQNISSGLNAVTSQTKQIDHVYESGKWHSRFLFDYLNEPGNTLPRTGAIFLGGLSGYIIGLRHSFFRRILYTAIGTGALASVCYPKEAEIYAQKGLVELKTWSTIGVNFVYGIKPGDEAKPIEIPSSLTNAYNSMKNTINWFKKD